MAPKILPLLFFLGGLVFSAVIAQGQPPVSTMPIEDVRPGMRGYGLTVFRGTEPERFEVEVIDVLHRFRPGMDLILIRTEHPLLEHAGTVAGMSGSPIYIDGKLIGAYAYGWAFGKDPVAGVTPIANMLREGARPLRPHGAQEARVSVPRSGSAALAQAEAGIQRHHPLAVPESVNLVPATTPLMLSGFSDAMRRYLAQSLAPLGLVPLQAGGGQSAGRPGPFVPGGALGVQLVRGDMSATAVGTVTHVSDDTVLAFGHPMMNAGQTALPVAAARVLHILASQSRSFKLAEALGPAGTLVQDRQPTIVVDAGRRAPTVPLELHLRTMPSGEVETWRVELAKHPLLTPVLAFAVLQNVLSTSLSDQDPAVVKVTSTLAVASRGNVVITDAVASETGPANAASLRGLRMFQVLSAVHRNPFERGAVDRIRLDLEVTFGQRVCEVVGASIARETAEAGEPLLVQVRLREFGQGDRVVPLRVNVPEDAAGETLLVTVEGGNTVQLETPLVDSLAGLLGAIQARPASTALVLSTKRQSRGLRFHGHVLRGLPGSALRTLQAANDSGEGRPFVSVDRQLRRMGRVVTGRAQVRIPVEAP